MQSDLAVQDAPTGKLAVKIPGASAIEQIIGNAAANGTDPATMRELVALCKEMKAMRAVEEFNVAFAAFRAECPPIPRRTINTQFKVVRNGVQEHRKYASLEDIESTVRSVLGRHGLSYRWGSAEVKGDTITMECIVAHAGGHSVASPVSMKHTSSAGCSDQQKYGIAITYAQRYSLIMALGLTTCDEDADGNDEPPADGPKITADQVVNIADGLTRIKRTEAQMCARFKIARLEDMPASQYAEAMDLIAKAEAKAGGK